jgi:Mn-dependent DtxR family transcriptional regulator/AraC-like DNA-binding protein
MLRLVFNQIRQSLEAGIDSEIYYAGKILELLFLTASHAQGIEAPRRSLRILTNEDMIAVNAAKRLIDSRLGRAPLISELTSLTNTSAAKLQRDFQTACGCTLHGYVQQIRMKAALQKIEDTTEPIYQIAESVGCKNPGRFSELFRQAYGLTPSEYRSAARNAAQGLEKKHMDKLTTIMEGYLDAVYELSVDCAGVRLIDVANRMSVTKSTAGAAMASLAQKGLIKNERYRRIELTDNGRQEAELLTNKHNVIRLYYSRILKLDEETADRDACAIEHVISDSAIRAMRERLAR